MVNEQLWIGHFDIWNLDGVIMYRHALFLRAVRRSIRANARP